MSMISSIRATPRSPGLLSSLLSCSILLMGSSGLAHAQISLTSAVDMALRNSQRVKMAESDIDRARAGLAQAKDVYIPNLYGATSGLGYAYGFPLGAPTLFTISSGALVFSFSQRDYIRAATSGLTASTLALRDVRQSVAEDTVNTFLDLARAVQQRAILAQENEAAGKLQSIVKQRLDAGVDPAMDYTRARRTGVQIRLQMLLLDDELATQNNHLSHLLGLGGAHVNIVPDSIPPIHVDEPTGTPPDTPGVQAAFVSAHQKLEQAFGDARYLLRPQVNFGAQYAELTFYNNNYLSYYPYVTGENPVTGLGKGTLPARSAGFAFNVNLPIFDRSRSDRAVETMAEAVHSQHDAENIRDQQLEGRLKLQHSTTELALRAELASYDRDLAQQELEVIQLQLQNAPAGTGPAITPKDEQNALIHERQLFFDMLDAQFKLRQVQINLLRQSGQLETWLKSAAGVLLAPTP